MNSIKKFLKKIFTNKETTTPPIRKITAKHTGKKYVFTTQSVTDIIKNMEPINQKQYATINKLLKTKIINTPLKKRAPKKPLVAVTPSEEQ